MVRYEISGQTKGSEKLYCACHVIKDVCHDEESLFKICEITQQSKSETKNVKNIINALLKKCYSFSKLLGSIFYDKAK